MCRGQGDYFQATRGGGHGDYRFIVLAPSTAQEAVDLVEQAFHLADKWRNPVMIMGDFLLSHTSELVEFRRVDESDLPPKTWATTGAAGRRGHHADAARPVGEAVHRRRATRSRGVTEQAPRDQGAAEVRVDTGYLDDAELVVVAFGFPGRFVKYAVAPGRAQRAAGRLRAADQPVAVSRRRPSPTPRRACAGGRRLRAQRRADDRGRPARRARPRAGASPSAASATTTRASASARCSTSSTSSAASATCIRGSGRAHEDVDDRPPDARCMQKVFDKPEPAADHRALALPRLRRADRRCA